MSVSLAAIVVTCNRRDKLRTCLSRLLATPVSVVVVVDNASADGTAAMLAAIADPRLHVVALGRNTGGAGGFEAGLRLAHARFDPDWCVLMDDDSWPEPGTIEAFLADVSTFAGYEAIAAAVHYPDGTICDMNRPSRNPFWHMGDFLRTLIGGRGGFHLTDAAYAAPGPVEIDATSFVGFFLSRAGIRRGGFPDGRLFIYADDVIHTLALTLRGGRIGFVPRLRFTHDCATYARDGSAVYRPMWKVYYNYRNSLRAYRVAAGRLLFWLVLALAVVKWSLRARQVTEGRDVYRRLLRLAVSDALSGDLDRTHDEVLALSRLPSDPPLDEARPPCGALRGLSRIDPSGAP